MTHGQNEKIIRANSPKKLAIFLAYNLKQINCGKNLYISELKEK